MGNGANSSQSYNIFTRFTSYQHFQKGEKEKSRICVNFQKNKKKYRKRDKYTVSYIQYSLIDLFGRSRISLLYLDY